MKKGQAYSGLNRYEDALSAYNESISLDSHLAEAWYSKGLAMAHLGRYIESIQAFDKAIDIHPRAPYPGTAKGSPRPVLEDLRNRFSRWIKPQTWTAGLPVPGTAKPCSWRKWAGMMSRRRL